MSSVGARVTFSSPDGYKLVRDTVRDKLPYAPHDYQLEGVCKLLDGADLVAVIPTGAGKTSYYVVYMLMLLELSKNINVEGAAAKVPADPCIVMVYPTNGLEEEQATVFERAGINTLVLNATTLSLGRRSGQDLWRSARTGVSVLLLSPEQLVSPGFEGLLQHAPFQKRLCALGIDEIHLLYSWGQAFRQAFQQIGFARARMSLQTRMIGTTATLLAGHPEETILRFLGLRRGEFHLIRRSNLRRNVRTIFRTLSHGLGGWSFADLRWILASGRKTVIHCQTIALGFRLAIYLWRLAPPSPDRRVRIRMYNALNWPSYNTETRELMRHDPNAQIIIATATFMVGIDLPNIADVVILGHVLNADEHVQWEGRAGRDPRVVADARCITYVTATALKTARALCAGEAPQKTSGGKNSKPSTPQMELSMARLLCADCVSVEQDTLYDNPLSDPPCLCPACVSPPSSMSLPARTPMAGCTCSGPHCEPEDVLPVPILPAKSRGDTNPIPQRLRISNKMRKVGEAELEALRMRIYLAPGTAHTFSLPPNVYLPDPTIKELLDHTLILESKDALRELISGRVHLLPHIDLLWTEMRRLAELFQEMKREKAALDREKRKQRKVAANGGKCDHMSEDVPGTSAPAVILPAICDGSVAHMSSTFTFRIDVPRASEAIHAGMNAAASSALSGSARMVGGSMFEWNLNDGSAPVELSMASASSSRPAGPPGRPRKRAGTTTALDLRPQTRQRVANKENTVPER